MKTRLLIPAALLIATPLVGLTACGSDDPSTTPTTDPMMADPMMADPMTADPMTTDPMATDPMGMTGTFSGANDKAVSGTVTIEGDQLTLSGFSSDEGPDLHLYLANGSDEAAVADGMVLGTVAWDEASQTFTLDGVDPAGFTTVVVHCDKAKAVFGAAELA